MKYVFAGTMLLTFYWFFFGSVKNGGIEETNIFKRFSTSFIVSFIISLMFGIPILGIIHLFY